MTCITVNTFCNCSTAAMTTMPKEWRELMVQQATQIIENPTGVWADFNCVYQIYLSWVWALENRTITEDELPPEPQPEDYPDLNSPQTVFCQECDFDFSNCPERWLQVREECDKCTRCRHKQL